MFNFDNLNKNTVKDITIKDIGEWCVANNQVKWLKAKAAETVDYKVHPRIKVWEPAKNKYVSRVDKSAEPTIEKRPISFVQIKSAFLAEFFNYKPEAKKEANMFDYINSL